MERLPKGKYLSHRLRGYADYENSASGLQKSLAHNVGNIEFDVRITKDDVLILGHDPFFETSSGKFDFYSNLTFEELSKVSKFPVETLESFLEEYSLLRSKQNTAFLHIDIKFSGYEQETLNLILHYLNFDEFYIVSWLPEVLLKYHEISSEIRLCLSHIPAAKFKVSYWFLKIIFNSVTTPFFAKIAKIYSARRSVFYESLEFRHKNFNRQKDVIHNKNVICVFKPYAGPDLLSVVEKTKGYVCIPVESLSDTLVDYYKSKNVNIASFSYLSHEQALDYDKRYDLDLYYSNFQL